MTATGHLRCQMQAGSLNVTSYRVTDSALDPPSMSR